MAQTAAAFNDIIAKISTNLEDSIRQINSMLEADGLTDDEKDSIYQALSCLEMADESLGSIYRD